MFSRRKIANPDTKRYATRADFCRIFEEDMNRLYLLSFLLTGNRATAEKCFVGGLDDSGNGNPIFKEWAESWTRRLIIQNAIRMVQPGTANGNRSGTESEPSVVRTTTDPPEISEVLALSVFERFVFVMSVLEGYSDQECSLLLGCAHSEVASARTRTLHRMGESAEQRTKLLCIAVDQRAVRDDRGSAFQEALSGLPVSA